MACLAGLQLSTEWRIGQLRNYRNWQALLVGSHVLIRTIFLQMRDGRQPETLRRVFERVVASGPDPAQADLAAISISARA
jgi:hypothetical protein